MSRYETAYLEVEDNTSVGVFEFERGLTTRSELDKNYLMGRRGQYVSEIFNITDSLGEMDSTIDRRSGFWLDGGAGNYSITVSFETGLEDVTWGDGSGGDGQANVHRRDASGEDVKPLSRKHVLDLWLARTLTDSRNPARLFWGEWTDGSKAEHSSAGAFGQAFPCAVVNYQPEMPDPNTEGPSSFTGTIELAMLTPFADYTPPSWLQNSTIGVFGEEAAEALGVIPDE